MGKKAKEFQAGDFIFAKVKGYPAWPARVQKINGKKYFVYFYGTAEIANLPPQQIFDYAENKDKFLAKCVKRKDFNEGIRQIEHDFANNVPLEDVIGVPMELPVDTSATSEGEYLNDTSLDATATADTTADTSVELTAEAETSQTQGDDSDDGALVIDEKKKPKKTPAKPVKEKATPKPKGKPKKDETPNAHLEEEGKKEEEIISRSGRKIRPKRYIDEHTEENATLAPVSKKKRGTSPQPGDKEKGDKTPARKLTNKQCLIVAQSELENIKEPFPENDKEGILIAHLPSGQYVGVKLFQSKPNSFSTESGKLQWYKTAAANAITLKEQLEKGQITSQSVSGQLETDLNLTDEEKANLDKEREIEEKKSRVQFLKTEMKLIELDSKIKSSLSLEKADVAACLGHLNELMEMEIKPLMLLKHPTCLETIKRSRSYVGNTPSWEMSEQDADNFTRQAHDVRKLADDVYTKFKELYETREGLTFWEYFSERVMLFKRCTSKLNADELLEMMHEPIEMSMPTSHTNVTAVETANEDEDKAAKKKSTPAKAKKPPAKKEPTPKPTPKKRGRPEAEATEEKSTEPDKEKNKEEAKKVKEGSEKKKGKDDKKEDDKSEEVTNESTKEVNDKVEKKGKSKPKKTSESDSNDKETNSNEVKEKKNSEVKEKKNTEVKEKKNSGENEAKKNSTDKEAKNSEDKDVKKNGQPEGEDKEDKDEGQKEKEDIEEPVAKKIKENSKKTEPPPVSRSQRKSRS